MKRRRRRKETLFVLQSYSDLYNLSIVLDGDKDSLVGSSRVGSYSTATAAH